MTRNLFLILFLLFSFSALAVHPDEILKDPVLEARARDIGKNLRCLVCQGEAIDESQAPLAADIRKLVRERLVAGDTDAEVTEYVRKRYGDYVLMSPPLSPRTVVLWLAPFAVIAAGFFVVRRLSRKGG